ncbi:hypothetical protein GCM10010245_81610 [Streptomyces spectabilis]|nr:hypothetical protein GCM10010245_81610 [Streptomyces spectabilis]
MSASPARAPRAGTTLPGAHTRLRRPSHASPRAAVQARQTVVTQIEGVAPTLSSPVSLEIAMGHTWEGVRQSVLISAVLGERPGVEVVGPGQCPGAECGYVLRV